MDDDGIDIGGLVGLLRRRLWLIAGVMALVVAVAGIALFAIRPVYTATALVLVDPSTKNLLAPETPLASASSDALRVESEVELVKSETVLLAVARDLDIAGDPEFGLAPGLGDKALAFLRLMPPPLPSGDAALARVMENFRSAVSAERRGATFLIAVSGRSARPDFAARIANAVARTYIGQQLDAKIASTLQSRDIVEARLSDAGAGVAQSERAFDTFVEQNLARIGEATGRSDLAALNTRISVLARSRATLAARAGTAEQGLDAHDWAAVATSLGDQAVAELDKRRQALAARLAGAAAGSDDAVDLKASLARLDGDLAEAATKAVSRLKSQLADTQGEATKLREQLRSAILAADLPPDILTGIYKVQQQAENARSQYQVLLARRNDLDNQAFLQVADSRVVSEALPPTEPSFPNPRLVLGLSGFVGLLLGIGCAVIAENFVGGFVSEAQAAALLKVPVAAAVPRQRQGRSDAGNVADRLVNAPLSAFAEAIRRLRLRLDQAVGSKSGAVIMVSSAAPGEGKTTMALALARAYALSGLSTLLIDCDLRKPGVHLALGRQASDGLFDYLAGKVADLGAIIALDAMSGAQVVLGSRRSDGATDQLVSGKAFARLLAAARENFDVVILDTPPVGPVVDGLYLTGKADAVVVVVEWAATPQQQVRTAVEALAAAGPAPLVAVLNRQQGGTAAYRGGYYAD